MGIGGGPADVSEKTARSATTSKIEPHPLTAGTSGCAGTPGSAGTTACSWPHGAVGWLMCEPAAAW
jgi:hypothetical protein